MPKANTNTAPAPPVSNIMERVGEKVAENVATQMDVANCVIKDRLETPVEVEEPLANNDVDCDCNCDYDCCCCCRYLCCCCEFDDETMTLAQVHPVEVEGPPKYYVEDDCDCDDCCCL
jgi:hypothetical protein